MTAGACSTDNIHGYARPRRGHAASKECNWKNAERAEILQWAFPALALGAAVFCLWRARHGVVEILDIKKQLLSRLDEVRKPDAIVTTNTSGISVEAMSSHCSEEFQQHFFGTHYFNPPRYMRLVEIIPTSRTSDEVLKQMVAFVGETLGKGVVYAEDTPDFIANRIGVYGMMKTLRLTSEMRFTVEQVDAQGVGRDAVLDDGVAGGAGSAHPHTVPTVVGDDVVGIARHVEHFHFRIPGRQALGELRGAQPGHDHVGEQQVDGAVQAPHELTGLQPVLGFPDDFDFRVIRQKGPQPFSKDGVVFGNDDAMF